MFIGGVAIFVWQLFTALTTPDLEGHRCGPHHHWRRLANGDAWGSYEISCEEDE